MRLLINMAFFALVLVLGSSLATTDANNDPLSVTSISLDPRLGKTQLAGSMLGGQAVIFEGFGFDPVAENNVVFIGSHPCIPRANGVTLTRLVCYTSPFVQGSGNYSFLASTVAVVGKNTVTIQDYNFRYAYY